MVYLYCINQIHIATAQPLSKHKTLLSLTQDVVEPTRPCQLAVNVLCLSQPRPPIRPHSPHRNFAFLPVTSGQMLTAPVPMPVDNTCPRACPPGGGDGDVSSAKGAKHEGQSGMPSSRVTSNRRQTRRVRLQQAESTF